MSKRLVAYIFPLITLGLTIAGSSFAQKGDTIDCCKANAVESSHDRAMAPAAARAEAKADRAEAKAARAEAKATRAEAREAKAKATEKKKAISSEKN